MRTLAATSEVSRAGRLVAVGTGTCVPRLRRGGPCLLLEVSGYRCAVDLGLGALHGLLRAGVDPTTVDALLFTHHHPDHLAEVLSFLFAANYGWPPRRRPLQWVASSQTLKALDRLVASQDDWLAAKGYRRTVSPLRPGDTLSLGPLRVQAGAVRHLESSLAYRFEIPSGPVVITGDSGPTEALVELARGARVLFAEASLAPGEANDGHLTAAQAGALAHAAGVEQLVLVHLYPTADAAAPAAAAAARFGGSVTVAEDGMEWDV